MSIMQILTPAYFREVYLQGVRTSLAACGLGGSANAWSLPDSVIMHHLTSAVSYVATTLDIDLQSHPNRQFTRKYDQMDWHGERWYLKTSPVRPVKRVYKLEIQHGPFVVATDGFVELPLDWVQIGSEIQGSIFVTPYSGAPASIAHLPWGTGMDTWYRWMPLFMRVTQSTGFEFELVGTVTATEGSATATISGTGADNLQNTLRFGQRVKLGSQIVMVTDIPTSSTFTFDGVHNAGFSGTAVVMDYDPMVLDVVAYQALIPILETIAARLFGPVMSKSTSADSMSQSKSYAVTPQTSAMYSMQSRATERRDELMVALAARYASFNMASW